MATYTMLGMYTYEKITADDFKISFEIPDNCNYAVNIASGKYTIEIHLNPDQKTPSANFVQQTETLSLIGGELNSKFEQFPFSGLSIKKPDINIKEI